jgi:hypothetical protein
VRSRLQAAAGCAVIAILLSVSALLSCAGSLLRNPGRRRRLVGLQWTVLLTSLIVALLVTILACIAAVYSGYYCDMMIMRWIFSLQYFLGFVFFGVALGLAVLALPLLIVALIKIRDIAVSDESTANEIIELNSVRVSVPEVLTSAAENPSMESSHEHPLPSSSTSR